MIYHDGYCFVGCPHFFLNGTDCTESSIFSCYSFFQFVFMRLYTLISRVGPAILCISTGVFPHLVLDCSSGYEYVFCSIQLQALFVSLSVNCSNFWVGRVGVHTYTHTHTHTHKIYIYIYIYIYNTYFLSTTTVVVRTLLNVTLYDHCLSCWQSFRRCAPCLQVCTVRCSLLYTDQKVRSTDEQLLSRGSKIFQRKYRSNLKILGGRRMTCKPFPHWGGSKILGTPVLCAVAWVTCLVLICTPLLHRLLKALPHIWGICCLSSAVGDWGVASRHRMIADRRFETVVVAKRCPSFAKRSCVTS